MTRLHLTKHVFLLSVLLILTACGFHLRGYANLSFNTIYITNNNSELVRELTRSIKTTGVKIVNQPELADVVLEITKDDRNKRILSLGSSAGTSTGAVREFELFHSVAFRLKDKGNANWNDTQQIENRRDFSYSDIDAIGKAFEEAQLYDNMRSDAIRQIVRALAAHHPNLTSTPAKPDAAQ